MYIYGVLLKSIFLLYHLDAFDDFMQYMGNISNQEHIWHEVSAQHTVMVLLRNLAYSITALKKYIYALRFTCSLKYIYKRNRVAIDSTTHIGVVGHSGCIIDSSAEFRSHIFVQVCWVISWMNGITFI